jgi:competence protein ComEC
MDAIKGAAASAWAAQHDRWALWPPVAMIFGAAAWMIAPADPAPWMAPVLAVLGLSAAVLLVRLPGAPLARLYAWASALALMGGAFGLGATSAQVRTTSVATPRIERELGPVRIEGWVMEAEPGATRPRIRILVHSIEGLAATPRYARISVHADGVLPPGRAAHCLVILRPPEGPLAPRAYHFARRAYFMQIGASGFALGRCRPADIDAPRAWKDRALLQVAALRRDLTDIIFAMAPTEGGAIAAAMVTGDRSLMSEETNIAFRDSGLGHLLSVSGLHMALVAGGVYATMHFLLALVGPLALRFPIRKWAAATALLAAGAYLFISGASVPAQRAFVMSAVALGAVLFDRSPFTLRALGVAAAIVVLIAPESVVEPGFQMSFAATAALVAAFETRKLAEGPPAPGFLLGGLQASWRTMSDMLLASAVAGLATDPFAIFHFQRISVYGLASNLASTPIITFLIAPAAVAAAALSLVGLAEPAVDLMAAGLDMVRAIGAVFAERPEAVRALPLAPLEAFLAAVGALLWICLWQGWFRWLGLAGLAAAGGLYLTAPRAVLLADGDLRAVVARTPERWIVVGDAKRGAFARNRLGGLAGLSAYATERLSGPDGCDTHFCTWTTPGGRTVVRVWDERALAHACRREAIVLSSVALPKQYAESCALSLSIDPQALTEAGGLSVTESPQGLIVQRAGRRDARPWSGDLRRSDE